MNGDPPGWLADDDMDIGTRRWLAEFLTPRRGLDGRLYWSVGELPREVHDG